MSDVDPPATLGERGASLWRGLRKEGSFGPPEVVLVMEACRIADRLDKLDDLIIGGSETWIDLIETYEGSGIADVVINKPLAEARQQALALKQILAELRQMRGVSAGDSGGDELDELAARRAARIANAAGS